MARGSIAACCRCITTHPATETVELVWDGVPYRGQFCYDQARRLEADLTAWTSYMDELLATPGRQAPSRRVHNEKIVVPRELTRMPEPEPEEDPEAERARQDEARFAELLQELTDAGWTLTDKAWDRFIKRGVSPREIVAALVKPEWTDTHSDGRKSFYRDGIRVGVSPIERKVYAIICEGEDEYIQDRLEGVA